jgi:signal transduction histidine kinase
LLDFLSPRLALRQHPGERIEIERILALARVVLAVSSLVALYLDSTESFGEPNLVLGLVVLYSGHAIALLALLWRWDEVSPRFSWAAQAADIVWPCLISFFTNGPDSPFFLYFIFALLAAAFRWGMVEALLTMLVAIAAMPGETFALNHAWFAVPAGGGFGIGFMMRIVYLIIFAFLIGYLAESEKRRRAEVSSVAQVSSKARVEAGLKATLQASMQELLELFRARELLLVAREAGAQGANLWRVERLENTGEVIFTWRQLDEAEAQEYLSEMPAHGAAAVWQGGNTLSAIMIDREGKRLSGRKCRLSPEFVSQHPFDRLLTTSILFAPDLSCRLFLFEPSGGGQPEAQLRFLRDLTNRVAPAIYNVYLLRRLRSRAAAIERARVARDLHDGVVQSLHALAFRLYALRTGTMGDRERTQELLDLQELVQKEASNLRRLMQQLKPVEVDPRRLVEFLMGMIERYGYDTGIAAKFVCDAGDVTLPPATCREIAGIVQEALANVLKHSGAESVLVRLASQAGAWILTIQDDGRGFEFSGRFSQPELERIRRGPSVIKERARAIGGELTIDSRPGQGSRLEIKFPQPAQPSLA